MKKLVQQTHPEKSFFTHYNVLIILYTARRMLYQPNSIKTPIHLFLGDQSGVVKTIIRNFDFYQVVFQTSVIIFIHSKHTVYKIKDKQTVTTK